MASHTISAKYIPNTSLDYFNSLLNGVEQKTADGSLVTFHLESFSCRMSRADKQHFENQRKEHTNENNNNSMGNTTYNSSTPNITPYAASAVTPKQPLYNDDYDNDFRFDNEPPTSSQSQQNGTFPAFNANTANTAAFFMNESSAPNAAAPSSHFGNTPPTSPQIGLGLGSSTSYLSPQTLTASAAQSGRPCFPEFFVIPNDLRSSHLSSSAASPMGYPYGSASSGAMGGADGEEGTSTSEDPMSGTNQQQQQPQQQQQRQLSANWYGLTPNNNLSGGSDSTNGGGSGSQQQQQQQAFNSSSNRPHNNNNNNNSDINTNGTFPPSFRLPDSDNTLQQTNPNTSVGATMGGRSASNGGSNNNNQQLQNPSSPFPQNQQQQQQFYVPATREEAYVLNQKIISDRLIYLVGALNSLYGTAEYDFSVLGPTDFVLVNPISFISDVTSILGELPTDVLAYTGQHGESLWRAIGSMIGGETSLYDASTNMSECDVFLFNCPSCDPTAQTKMWSSHYFIYHKKNKVIISVIIFGEAANKRDGGVLGGIGGGGSGMHSAGSAGLLSALGLGADDARRGKSNSAGGGEYYIDSYGNTHYIGGDADDDDGIDGGAERRRRQVEGGGWSSPYPMSPTSAGGVSYGEDETDTPQYVQASMTDVNSEWGNDDAM